ncbi:MAG TPA: FAD-binding protein [Chloroflexota bacterium]|nr:FAD-binding protein [Chloroflexota bacterium]
MAQRQGRGPMATTMMQTYYTASIARAVSRHPTVSGTMLRWGAATLSLLCLVSLLARVSVPVPGSWPLAADCNAATLFVLALVLYHLPFDLAAPLIVGGFVVLLRLILGPTYAAGRTGTPLGVGIALALIVALNYGPLMRGLRVPLPADRWPVRLLKATHDLLCAAVQATLLTLLDLGYRPDVQAALQAEARRQRIRREHVHWRNWGRTAACDPQLAFFPETLADLMAIVAEARATRRRVRVAAAGHSWPALVSTNDVLVVMHQLDTVTVNLGNPQRPLLVAEAGATNRQMNDVLERHGLVLPFNVGQPRQERARHGRPLL